jgi:tetratricopeptide (TPR) repeat protein
VLDITPNDLEVMATKASIYQAQGNLREAAKLLSGVNEKTPNEGTFLRKISQVQYERNYREGIRLLQTRLAQFHYDLQELKASDQATLAFFQRLAGDTAGSKVNCEEALNTLQQFDRDEPNNPLRLAGLSQIYAVMGQKELALELAKRAVMLNPREKDPILGPIREENLAFVQATVGENRAAISTLTRLLQTPYTGFIDYPAPITPALLRLDPSWDPLRADPAFHKLCEEKQP